MFGRLTTVCCSVSRQICREISAVHQQAKFTTVVATGVPALDRIGWRDDHKRHSVYQDETAHSQVCASRCYASKAAKFGKKIKKETFDRYLGMDPSRLQHGFEDLEELKDASETVRRLFSLEFAPGREIKKLQEAETLEDVEHDPSGEGYTNFLVTSITRLTVAIRNLAPHVERFPRDKKNKRMMLHMIDRRRKHIKFLCRTNYDLANRLLATLKVEYSPAPRYSHQQTKRLVEKTAVCREAFNDRTRALEEFTGQMRMEQLKEIAEIKKSLGVELTDEEMSRLEQ